MSLCQRILTRHGLRASPAVMKTTSTSISSTQFRQMHSSKSVATTTTQALLAEFERRSNTIPKPPESRENPMIGIAPAARENVGQKRFADFNLNGRVFVVTGGARGLGLSLAEALAETGGNGTSAPPAPLYGQLPLWAQHTQLMKLQCTASIVNRRRARNGVKRQDEPRNTADLFTTGSKTSKIRKASTGT